MKTSSMDTGEKQITFYSRPEYFQDLINRINQAVAGDRIALASMTFEPKGAQIHEALEALCAAAKRGVRVSLAVDAHIFLLDHHKVPAPLWFYKTIPTHMPAPFRAKLQALERLQACGGRYTITNQPGRPFRNPFAGRSHIKFAIINNRLYVGGCNFTNDKQIDTMVGWDDQRAADWLYDLSEKMISNQGSSVMQYQDISLQVDPKTTLLVDSGRRKQSLILDTALQLIDNAKESIFITCQFFPNDITAKHLLKAHERGVEVTVVYNHPSKHIPPHNVLHHLVVLREHARVPANFFKNELSKQHLYIHAKLIATEQGAIVGSHNYVSAGVNFGTAEIALIRHDPTFAKEAVTAMKHYIETGKQ